MNQESMSRTYDEIERHLRAFHLPSMHVTALAGLLMADVVGSAIRDAERAAIERCARVLDQEAEKLDAEQERVKTIDPAHYTYCRNLAYHAGRYAMLIRKLS
jgi:acyl-CoA reductase-like NAD-dependent aldehyde dehydrogenase